MISGSWLRGCRRDAARRVGRAADRVVAVGQRVEEGGKIVDLGVAEARRLAGAPVVRRFGRVDFAPRLGRVRWRSCEGANTRQRQAQAGWERSATRHVAPMRAPAMISHES